MNRYTTKLAQEGQSFREFILLCARQIGHLQHMVDRPDDEDPDPDFKFMPEAPSVKDAERKIEYLNSLSEVDREGFIKNYIKEKRGDLKTDIRYVNNQLKRFADMEGKVLAWEPDADYLSIKKIALIELAEAKAAALTELIRFEKAIQEEVNETRLFQSLCEQYSRDLENAKTEAKATKERTEQNHKWISGLLESVKQ